MSAKNKEPATASGDDPTRSDPTHPNYYKKTVLGAANTDIEELYKRWDGLVSAEESPHIEAMVRSLAAAEPPVQTPGQLNRALHELRKQYSMVPKKSQLLYVYEGLVQRTELAPLPALRALLQKKSSKSQSGVLVITVLTSPYPSFGEGSARKTQRFSCEWNCYYCPNEPDQPRSYLHDEPAVLRANQNGFDPVLQFTERAVTLAAMGHPVDKIELLVLGGTWASYPEQYQIEFVRDLFYAANTFWDRDAAASAGASAGTGKKRRARRSLAEEQTLNEHAAVKVIGLTLETRPDCIDTAELRRLRRLGCTRVQLGLQHTDDVILRKVNRGSTRADAERALRLLKNACYKVDVHLMPNLPGASVEADRRMFDAMLECGAEGGGALQADQWKIYPCEVLPWTVLQKWAASGEFVPYPDKDLFELILETKQRVHPWIRLNRVVRDIPSQYILGGVDAPNMRQELQAELERRGGHCACIRCREVGLALSALAHGDTDSKRRAKGRGRGGTEAAARAIAAAARVTVREYTGSGGRELFIAVEAPVPAELRGGGAAHGGGGGAGDEGEGEGEGEGEDGKSGKRGKKQRKGQRGSRTALLEAHIARLEAAAAAKRGAEGAEGGGDGRGSAQRRSGPGDYPSEGATGT